MKQKLLNLTYFTIIIGSIYIYFNPIDLNNNHVVSENNDTLVINRKLEHLSDSLALECHKEYYNGTGSRNIAIGSEAIVSEVYVRDTVHINNAF